MKHLPVLLLPALLAVAVPALCADWLVIGAETRSVLMLDRASLRRGGDAAEAWLLRNHESGPAALPQRSERLHLRFDCRAGTLAVVETIAFSGSFGTGSEIDRSTADAPRFAAPAQQTERMLLEMACAK